MAQMNQETLRATLKQVRKRSRPPCRSLDEFENLMRSNATIRDAFGNFRDESFYQTTLKYEDERATLFVVQPLAREIPASCRINVDGTFRTAPIGSKQVLIVAAEIGGKVITN